MNHILKVAPKSWQNHSSDITVSLGPLPSLPYPAARCLRKPQFSHYGYPSVAWRQDGHFCQLTGTGTSQQQQCRPCPPGLNHAHKDPPPAALPRPRQSHCRALRGAWERAPGPSLPCEPAWLPPPPGDAARLSGAWGLAPLPEDSSLFFPVHTDAEILPILGSLTATYVVTFKRAEMVPTLTDCGWFSFMLYIQGISNYFSYQEHVLLM